MRHNLYADLSCCFDFQNGVPSVIGQARRLATRCHRRGRRRDIRYYSVVIVESRARVRYRSREVVPEESWRSNAIARVHGVGRREIISSSRFSFSSFFLPSFFRFPYLDGDPDGDLDGNLPDGVLRGIQSINSVPPCCDR
jgi:hypothetical protein